MKGMKARRAMGTGTAGSETVGDRPPHVEVMRRRIDSAREEMQREWPQDLPCDRISDEALSRYNRVLKIAVRRVLWVREMERGAA